MREPQLATDLIDRKLGEFILREHIGEGGFGLVFRADQPTLERQAVVKVSQQVAGSTDDIAVQRFLREARLASRLDHPFAAHIYAFGAEPDGLLWIAMELVRGTPLNRVLDQAPLPLERAIPFLRRLCEVVQTAHDQGIVHRDLKPANVMVVARAGNVFPKLLDLGIAKDVRIAARDPRAAGDSVFGPASPTTTGRGQMGTPLYMAPEQWVDAGRAGPAADIYALGALTYEVLTGKPPFTGHSVLQIAAQHARRSPPALPDGFPAGMSAAITRAMAKRAGDRFATALELAEALRETSGISLDAINLPQIDDLTRDEVMMRAPQPIAEIVAALDAAHSTHEALATLWRVARTCAQYVCLIAVCCRTRAGPGRHGETPAVVELLAALRSKGLETGQWWRLARELCRPFADIPDAHPIPELVGLFFERKAELKTGMDALLDSRAREPEPQAGAEDVRAFLVGAVPALAATLRGLRFLHDYRLVIPGERGGELWMGVRRPVRETVTTIVARAIDNACLVDAAGTPIVSLSPVVQAAAPAPGAPPELFWLDGPLRPGSGRHGARLISEPGRYERSDDSLWANLGLQLAPTGDQPTTATDDEVTPYRGLMTFTEADAGQFFGREREVEGFVNRLRTTPLIAVVGPSGAGKSSFVQAGVLPALEGRWRSLVVRPGPTPLATLCARLAAVGIAITPSEIRTDPETLGVRLRARATTAALRTDGRDHVLLVVDQFEELFTLCLDPIEQDVYANALVHVARAADDSVRVVLTLRDDFLVRAAQLVALRDRLATSLLILTTPIVDDLIRILVEPARRAGFELEDDALPQEMVGEVAGQPAALALLSFTAYQLWQFRDRHFRILPRKAYRALGGVGGALAQHAEATLDTMTDDERQVVREVFRHLVTADGTRAVLSRAELLQVSGGDKAGPALEKLISARLLVAQEAATGESIEVVHEALLSAWPRLVRWRQEDADSARLRDQLRVSARQWTERGQPRGLLWRGEALTEYQLWRRRYPGALTQIEDSFGRTSVTDAARGRRLRRLALGAVIVGLVIALIVFARLRGDAEDSEAEAQQRLVDSYVETGRRALIEGDTTAALLYLNEGFQRGADTPAIRFMLARALEPLDAELATLSGHTGMIWDVELSPDGTRVATASADGTVRLWDAASGAPLRVLTGHPLARFGIAWSPDGSTLAATGEGPIKLWDPIAGSLRGELTGHAAAPTRVEYSPDGAWLLSAGGAGDPTARLWSVADNLATLTETFAPGVEIQGIGFSADSTRFVVATFAPGGASAPLIVRSVDGSKRVELVGHTGAVWYAAFDPSGRRVASASVDQTARIWDSSTGAVLHVLRGHDARVTDLAWSPDGSLLATASGDNTIKVWNAETGATRFGLRGHTAQVNRLRFTGDGRRLLSIATDGTARIWDPARGTSLGSFSHGGFLFQFDVSRDGKRLVTTSWLGTGKLWNLARADVARTLAGEPSPTAGPPVPPLITADGTHAIRYRAAAAEVWNLDDDSVRLLPIPGATVVGVSIDRGSTIAIAASSGFVHLHDLVTGVPRPAIHTEHGTLSVAALAATGDLLLTSGCAVPAAAAPECSLAAWDTATGGARARRVVPEAAHGMAMSSDGRRVVIGLPSRAALVATDDLGELADLGPMDSDPRFSPDDGLVAIPNESTVNVWTRDGRKIATLAHGSGVTQMVWSASGARLLVGQVDGGVQVWSATSWTEVARIAAHDLWIPFVAVSPDDTLLVTVGFDETVKIWDMATFRQLHQIRVAPRTTWGVIDPTGRRLLTSDGTSIDLRSTGATPLDPAGLRRLLDCELAFELKQGTVASRTVSACK